jgi:hypothetical protein
MVSGEFECDAAAGATRGRTRFVDRVRAGFFFAAAGLSTRTGAVRTGAGGGGDAGCWTRDGVGRGAGGGGDAGGDAGG